MMLKQIKLLPVALSVALALPTVSMAETLRQSVQHAVNFNPDVLFQAARRSSTEQGIREAKGGMFPTVDVRAGIGRQKTRSPTTRAINAGDSNTRTLDRKEASLELVQNIFAGGAIMGEIKRNEELHNAEFFKLTGVVADTALSATERYLDVLRGHQLVGYAESNLREHERILSMISDRSTAGVSREAELEQAKGRLALARANLVTEKGNLREAYISYMRVVGEMPGDLKWPRVPSSRDLPRNLAHGIDLALANHPTLMSAFSDVEEAKAQHRVALASNYPRVDLILSASRNKDLDGLIGVNHDNLAVLRMNYNLFRGGSELARQRKTAYQIQEAFEVKNRSVAQVKESMRLSWNSLRIAQDRLIYLENYKQAANNTFGAYSEQFKVGKRTLLDLLDTINENYQARIDYLEGLYKEVFARYRVLNSTGRLASYLGVKVPSEVYNTDHVTSHERFNHGPELVEKRMKNEHMRERILEVNTLNRFASNKQSIDTLTEPQLAALIEKTKLDKNLSRDAQTYALTIVKGNDLAMTMPASSPELTVAEANPNSTKPAIKPVAKRPLVKKSRIALRRPPTKKIAKKSSVPVKQLAKFISKPVAAAPINAKAQLTAVGKHWYIQAGAFSKSANAERMLEQLRAKGYPDAFVKAGKQYNHVYVGPFTNKGQATVAQTELMAKAGVDAVLRLKALTEMQA